MNTLGLGNSAMRMRAANEGRQMVRFVWQQTQDRGEGRREEGGGMGSAAREWGERQVRDVSSPLRGLLPQRTATREDHLVAHHNITGCQLSREEWCGQRRRKQAERWEEACELGTGAFIHCARECLSARQDHEFHVHCSLSAPLKTPTFSFRS